MDFCSFIDDVLLTSIGCDLGLVDRTFFSSGSDVLSASHSFLGSTVYSVQDSPAAMPQRLLVCGLGELDKITNKHF